MSTRSDYKSVSPRQRRRSVRRNGLLVITLVLVGLFSGLLTYIKGSRNQEALVASAPPVKSASPVAPVTPPAPVVAVPAASESSKPKYDFYTELPKRQVGIQ